MWRIAGNRLFASASSSSSSLSSLRLNYSAMESMLASGSDSNCITSVISDAPSLNSATNSLLSSLDTDLQTLVYHLEACKLSSNLRGAAKIHSRIIKLGYQMQKSPISSLVLVYASCGCPNLAGRLLSEIPCWEFDLMTSNLIIATFMKIGEIDIAKKVFHNMPTRDVVSWNSMIGGFVKNACFKEALRIFEEMLSSKFEPDVFTFASVIKGCAQLGAREYGNWIHSLLIAKQIPLNYILRSALIDMYSKCGRIGTAKEIFEAIQRDDVSIWNTMINGLAVHGLALDAIAIFSRMVLEKISPDSITFVGILTACSHCGLVEEGRKYFDLMSHYAIESQLEHYGAMVDLLGRAGHLDEAYAIIDQMPMEPDVVIWRAFLSACRTHRNSNLGEIAIKKIEQLMSGDYILLANTYCSVNKWNSAERVRDAMRNNGVRKNIGKSSIEMAGVIHQFKAGDRSHREREAIYRILDGLIRRTRMEGFIPTKELVLMDVSDEEKEENLSYHSEKLALAYGILKSSPATEIQITKNLRTCLDCHCWMKVVSRILYRVIVVRDRIRFHRFEGGLCSCGDYW